MQLGKKTGQGFYAWTGGKAQKGSAGTPPEGLAARLARVLDDPGFCLVALDEGAEPDEALAPALADRLALFLDLDGERAPDQLPLPDPQTVLAARAMLPSIRKGRPSIGAWTRPSQYSST